MIIFLLKKTIMSLLKQDWSFSRKKKKEFPLRKAVFTKFSSNWLRGSGEGRFFFLIIKVLFLIFYHLPFIRDVTLLLKGHEYVT